MQVVPIYSFSFYPCFYVFISAFLQKLKWVRRSQTVDLRGRRLDFYYTTLYLVLILVYEYIYRLSHILF
jgi:hypothetical protein